MKKIQIIGINFLNWQQDPKYITAFLYLIFYTYARIHGLVDYSRSLGYPITPWVFPFLPGSGACFLPLMLSFVLLISDAPFRTKQQIFIIMRIGKRTWLIGQLIYLLLVSICFTITLWLLSWLWLLPEINWVNDWGKVLSTAAVVGGHGKYGVSFSIQYAVMKNTDPFTVTCWCAAVMVCVCYMLGVIMAASNLWLRKGCGAAIISALIAVSVIPNMFAIDPGAIKMFIWLSPLTWMDRSLMGNVGQYLPSYSYGIFAPLVIGLIISAILIHTIGKCNIESDKE